MADDDLQEVHARLFKGDIKKLKAIAKSKHVPWLQELRLLVRRALDVTIVNPERGGQ